MRFRAWTRHTDPTSGLLMGCASVARSLAARGEWTRPLLFFLPKHTGSGHPQPCANHLLCFTMCQMSGDVKGAGLICWRQVLSLGWNMTFPRVGEVTACHGHRQGNQWKTEAGGGWRTILEGGGLGCIACVPVRHEWPIPCEGCTNQNSHVSWVVNPTGGLMGSSSCKAAPQGGTKQVEDATQ